MPASSTAKKTATRTASTGTAKKTAASSTAKKQKPKVDPYDDPLAASPKPKPLKRSSSSSRKKAPKVEANPLGMMAAKAADPYDDPWADIPKAPRASKPAKAPGTRKSPSRVDAQNKRSAPVRAKKAEADPFDAPATPARVKKPSSKKSSPSRKGGSSGSRKRRGGNGFVTFLLSALIVLCVLFISLQLFNYTRFIQMRNAVDSDNFFAGTTIDGVDISQMTMEQALAYWETNIEPQYRNRSVSLENGVTVTAEELGYSSDYRDVIETAWKSQTSGTLAERYAALNKYSATGSGHSVTRRIYTDAAVADYAAKVAAAVDTPVKEPSITGFDHDSLSFTFAEGTPGVTIDQEKLASDICAALDNGGGSVTFSVSTTNPTYTVADMQGMYGLRAYAVTNASSSSSNRLTNIRLALGEINGLLLKPGEEFSFNEVVGKRTADKGYKVATAYNAGEVTEELGGGICQVSTTLFNAVVKSDLQVTERHNHSLPVSYVDKGKDAAVSWGNQDLKFINNTSEPVYIVAYLDSDKRVRIGVFGRLLEDGKYITVEAELTYTKEFETVYQYNAFLLPGAVEELQSGRNSYEAVAYKCTWSADGELLSKETLCQSKYRGRDCIIEYGP